MSGESTTPALGPLVTENYADLFNWYEYLVFAIVLASSLGIGVFFGVGGRNKTNEEFLMAGRSMSILPVTLSLICSFVSAITLLGNPVEVYLYGSQYTVIAFAFIPMTLALAYLYVPVYFSLQLTSAYQYFEWRFSRKVRLLLSLFACIHLIIYMPITVYGPSLALDQVAGIDYKISSVAIFLVCIAYSSLGGLKAVLWTDALQAVVMIVALIAVIVCGMIEIGGFGILWERAENSGRTEFFNFDPDPRTRHTFWTATIGGFLMWLPLFAATQAQVQRYNSVPSLRESRICLLFNMIGMMIVICLCSLIGLMIFAKYYNCDPVETEIITSADQLLPLFVMDVLRDYPVLPGLLVAGLTCGSLSTVSSALNSLTAIITEDYVKTFKKGISESKLTIIAKTVSTVAGLAAFGLVFIVAEINKTINISPFSTLMHGSFLGPILGAYTLGMFMPWTNDIGVLLGILVSIGISGFVGLGNIIAGRNAGWLPDQRLSLDDSGCKREGFTETYLFNENFHRAFVSSADTWKDDHESDSFALKAFSTSYIWLPGIGGLSTVIFGLIFSFIVALVDKKYERKVNKSLLSKPFMRLWKKCFGESYMSKYIDSDSPPFCGGASGEAKNNQSGNPLSIPRATLQGKSQRFGIFYGGVSEDDYGTRGPGGVRERNGIYYGGAPELGSGNGDLKNPSNNDRNGIFYGGVNPV